MPPASRAPAAPGADVPERILGVRKLGGGQQFEVQWHGQPLTTWEAVSRMRRQYPLLVQAFEQQQQQQQQPAEGAADSDEPMPAGEVAAPSAEGAAPADNASLQRQVAELAQLVKQQAQRAEEDQQRARQQQSLIEQLRASPAHSPQLSVHASPQRSPQPESRSITAAAASADALQSRFARKEPRAQDLQEYDGAAGAKLDAWLDELSLARMLYELNAREALRFAVSRLRGAALQWWLAMSSSAQDAISSTDALAAALRARFQPVTAARSAREQLDKLAQGSRGVNEYIAEFQRLRTQLPSMAEDDALYAFERGLRRELAVELRKQGVATLQEAIALVARVGGLLQQAGAPQGRAAAANQMDIDDSDSSAGRLNRIEATLNAMAARNASGMGAKTQTQRGYTQERERGASGSGRGGARGGGRGGRIAPRGPPLVPGVPEQVVRQRLDAQQCVRCGGQDHRSPACPNAISATGN